MWKTLKLARSFRCNLAAAPRCTQSIAFKSTTVVASQRRMATTISGTQYFAARSSGLVSSKSSVSHLPWSLTSLRAFAAKVEVPVPSMGDSITEGQIQKWVKQPGEYIDADEVIVIIDTDKVSVDVNTPHGGIIVEHSAKEGDMVDVGGPLFIIEPGPRPEGMAAAPAPTAAPPAPTAAATAPTGPPLAGAAPAAAGAPTPVPAAPKKVVGERTEYRVKMTPIRKTVAKRLKEAQNTAASLTTFNEINMGNLMAMRTEAQDDFVKRHGIKLGLMSPFLFASARALMKMPACNAQIQENEIVQFDFVDISVAIATPKGLTVPVLKNCNEKSISDLEKELADLATRARADRIPLEEMVGGTFTVSNGGVFGSMMGTPILNPPQSAILGMHGIFNRPIAQGKEVVIRPMMNVALTYDHRIVDGREAVLLLKQIKDYIENPYLLLLD